MSAPHGRWKKTLTIAPQERITVKMGNRWEDPDFSTLISCVSLLTRSCELPRDQNIPVVSEKDKVEPQPQPEGNMEKGSDPVAPFKLLHPPTQEQGAFL